MRLNTSLKELKFTGTKVTGAILDSGEVIECDDIIMNADYAHAVTHLLNGQSKPKEVLEKKKYSCSTFMLYLGLDKIYQDEPHHHIIFADNYRHNVEDIQSEKIVSDDMSVYVRNSSITDPSVAPAGQSGLYIWCPPSIPVMDLIGKHINKNIAIKFSRGSRQKRA